MNVASIKPAPLSGAMPVNKREQDTHEKTIQNQIVSLQEKMRTISQDAQMSTEEKSDKKKELQEKIQDLNNELKQYQIRKRQEEAAKRQEEAARQEQEAAQRQEEASAKQAERQTQDTGPTSETAKNNMDGTPPGDALMDNIEETQEALSRRNRTDNTEYAFPDEDARIMVTLSNTKEMLSNMNRIRTGLEGRIRTIGPDEEKLKLQKRMMDVSKGMGEKVQKVADSIADNQKDSQERKDKVNQSLKEFRDHTKNMKAVLPGSTTDSGLKEPSSLQGKVLITRKK